MGGYLVVHLLCIEQCPSLQQDPIRIVLPLTTLVGEMAMFVLFGVVVHMLEDKLEEQNMVVAEAAGVEEEEVVSWKKQIDCEYKRESG